MTHINVGIVEDNEDMRAYLVALVNAAEDMTLSFAAANYAEAIAQLPTTADICLVDIRLPDGNGIDFIKAMQESSGTKSLILTILGDRASVLLAFEIGANGYLLKDTPPDQIRRDIRAVIAGGVPISPQAAAHLLAMMAQAKNAPLQEHAEPMLTDREMDVLTLFSRGLSYKETANILDMSVHTVTGHVKAIYSKMGVHSRNEAIFEAVQNGWLDL